MFGDRLKELREDKSLTQEDLAKILGLKRTTISSYETNLAFPSFEIAIKIANYFNVSLDYLACRTKNPYNIAMENKVIREAVINLITTLRKHIK